MAKFLHLPDFSLVSKFQEDMPLTLGCTVAYERPSKDVIRFAAAHASLYDQFTKKRGRQIAEGRLCKNRHGEVVELPCAPGKAIETIKAHLGA